MEQNRITLDAHTLVWYVHEPSKSNLSSLALETIRSAERGGIIYVPTIALLEVLRVIEKGRYPLSLNGRRNWRTVLSLATKLPLR